MGEGGPDKQFEEGLPPLERMREDIDGELAEQAGTLDELAKHVTEVKEETVKNEEELSSHLKDYGEGGVEGFERYVEHLAEYIGNLREILKKLEDQTRYFERAIMEFEEQKKHVEMLIVLSHERPREGTFN